MPIKAVARSAVAASLRARTVGHVIGTEGGLVLGSSGWPGQPALSRGDRGRAAGRATHGAVGVDQTMRGIAVMRVAHRHWHVLHRYLFVLSCGFAVYMEWNGFEST